MDTKKQERMFKFLSTMIRRKGLKRIAIGLLPSFNNRYVFVKISDNYDLIKTELAPLESMDKALERLVRYAFGRTVSFELQSYIGKIDYSTVDSMIRQFNFEIKLNNMDLLHPNLELFEKEKTNQLPLEKPLSQLLKNLEF